MSVFVAQYVRAGACTQGTELASATLLTCALEQSQCPFGATFWSPVQLAQAVDAATATTAAVPTPSAPAAAICLTAANTNAALASASYCPPAVGDPTTTGACLVENTNVYQCVASPTACSPGLGTSYVAEDILLSSVNVVCQLCGLDASMDGDYDDLLTEATSATDPTGANNSTQGVDTTTTQGYTDPTTSTTPIGDGTTNGTVTGDGSDVNSGDYYGGDFYDGDNDPGQKDPDDYYYGDNADGADGDGYEDYYYGQDGDGDGDMDEFPDRDDVDQDKKKNSTNLWDEYQNLDENQKVEAGVVFGIVIGILVGCCLLLYIQRLLRKCCGRNDGIDKHHHHGMQLVGENGHATSDEEDDFEDRMI